LEKCQTGLCRFSKARTYQILTDATVKGANFEGANRDDAELIKVNFTRANLNDANFKGADIAQADFSDNSTFTMQQPTQACVNPSSKDRTVEDQPTLPRPIVDHLKLSKGAGIVPQCHSSWAERIKAYFTRSLSDGR
jgi:hypothetical protein